MANEPPPPPLYAGPVKRSMTIAGHTTSISLEPLFWHALEAAARRAGLPLSALVARIDGERITMADPPNLASAVRCWLLAASPAPAPNDAPAGTGDDDPSRIRPV